VAATVTIDIEEAIPAAQETSFSNDQLGAAGLTYRKEGNRLTVVTLC